MEPIKGLHHVTAVARNPQRNVDFYRNILGQRLVKRTVNFDSPDTYHFYFADESGTPGSVITFFAWPGIRPGVRGNGEAATVAYNVPLGSHEFWQQRLKKSGITPAAIELRFGQSVLPFSDPDGMNIELIEVEKLPSTQHWVDGPVPPQYALHGFHSVTLWVENAELTASLLTEGMGYRFAGAEEDRHRFKADSGELAYIVDVMHRPDEAPATFGAGSIHHIAFRVPTDGEQLNFQSMLVEAGFQVSPVMDRNYFHSIYFREQGGVLFELATDPPGFMIDEPRSALGENLKLPAWFETNRTAIEENLQPLVLKPVEKAGA